MDECRGCGAHIVWTITQTGARSPIDYMPSADGTVLVLQPQGLGELLAVVLSGAGLELARARELRLHKSHFATCPRAEQFK